MKSNTFNYSLLAFGIAAVMGVSTFSIAAGPTLTNDSNKGTFEVKNQAEATYKVAGNTTEQKAFSNEVTIEVNETASFTLTDNNTDLPINPQASSTVDFKHTLENTGNVTDTFTIKLANVTTGDQFDYNSFTISYTKEGNTTSVTIPSDGSGTIKLAPGEKANITIIANSNTVKKLDDKGVLTVSAESAYLQAKTGNTDPSSYTATNTDSAKTVAPLYAITKSAKTNLNNNTGKIFDVNNNQSYVIYTIVVKNEGTADGTSVNIEDTLPEGLVVIESGDNYVAPTTIVSRDSGTETLSTAVSPSTTNSGKDIKVTGQNIKIGETVTITFRAKKDSTLLASNVTLNNFAVVKDSTKDDSTTDIIDKSNDVDDTVYETKSGDDYKGKDNNSDAYVTTSAQVRILEISAGVNKEVGLVTPSTTNSTQNTYTYTVTNSGTDIIEAAGTGDNANAVKLSILPTETNDTTAINNDNVKISIAKVFVDANNNGVFDDGEIVLTGTNGIYDLNAATPFVDGSSTTRKGLAPGENVKIGVQVATNGTYVNGGTNDLGKFEVLTLSVVPKGIVNGTVAPTTNPSTTSKTTMQGITLIKKQALDVNCNGTIDSGDTDFTTYEITTAKPDECVIYDITATSTFSAALGLDITDLLILDEKSKFSAGATYVSDTAKVKIGSANEINATDGTPSFSGAVPSIYANVATLTPGQSAALKFRVKIKNAR